MKVFYSLLFTVFILSCSSDEYPDPYRELDQPGAVNIYCLSTPGELYRRVEYEYDNGKILVEKNLISGEVYSTTTYEYNSQGLLLKEITDFDFISTEKTYSYNTDGQVSNIVWKTIQYDSEGNVVDENEVQTPFEYLNGLLIKEWQNWGGFITYEYSDANVSVKTEYTTYGEKHHITSYKYNQGLLVEERKETVGGTLIYVRKFKYDTHDRLVSIQEDDKTVEENTYSGNRLIERVIRYFGIDPGFFPCNGNYRYQYEY